MPTGSTVAHLSINTAPLTPNSPKDSSSAKPTSAFQDVLSEAKEKSRPKETDEPKKPEAKKTTNTKSSRVDKKKSAQAKGAKDKPDSVDPEAADENQPVAVDAKPEESQGEDKHPGAEDSKKPVVTEKAVDPTVLLAATSTQAAPLAKADNAEPPAECPPEATAAKKVLVKPVKGDEPKDGETGEKSGNEAEIVAKAVSQPQAPEPTSGSEKQTTTPTVQRPRVTESLGETPTEDAAPVAAKASKKTPASDPNAPASDDAVNKFEENIAAALKALGVADDAESKTAQTTQSATNAVSSIPTPLSTADPKSAQHVVPAPATPQFDAQTVEANHDRIITSIRSELFPHGGTMQLRLDPPELGSMQVQISVRDGVMTASFQTTNDQATKMLSHSLDQLKQSLEMQGVTVGKIQVQQVPRDHQSSNQQDEGRGQHEGQPQDGSARQEQQRRDILDRMWRRLRGDADPLDLVA